MADEHKDQIRIVQETVVGKEITFAHIMGGGTDHISEAWTESTGGLWIICDRNHEYDTFRVCCDRIRYRSEEW